MFTVPHGFVNLEDSVRHLRVNEVAFVVSRREAGLVVAIAIGLGLVCIRCPMTGVSFTFSHVPPWSSFGPLHQTHDRTSLPDVRASCSSYRSDVVSRKQKHSATVSPHLSWTLGGTGHIVRREGEDVDGVYHLLNAYKGVVLTLSL